MAAPDLSTQLLHDIQLLSEPQQQQVLAYVRTLQGAPPKSGAAFVQLAGTIPIEELRLMEQAIEEGCEQVDVNGW